MRIRSLLKRLRDEKRPVRLLVARLLWLTRLSTLLKIRRRGYWIRYHPAAMASTLWVDSNAAVKDENIVRGLLRSGDAYVDVGANIGVLTLAARVAVGGAGKVTAIEAHPGTFRFLRDNIALNGFDDIQMFNVAIGDRTGRAKISNRRSDDQNTVVDTDAAGITVPLSPLDSLPLPSGGIRLLKIDVEGYELPVLRGARALLQRTALVYFEACEHTYTRNGYALKDVVSELNSHGFLVFAIDDAGLLSEIELDAKLNGCSNFLAARERVISLHAL